MPFKLTMFPNFIHLDLQKIGTEQERKTLRASLAVAMYGKKDHRVHEFFYALFRAGQSFVTSINGVSYCRLFSTLHGEVLLLR